MVGGGGKRNVPLFITVISKHFVLPPLDKLEKNINTFFLLLLFFNTVIKISHPLLQRAVVSADFPSKPQTR